MYTRGEEGSPPQVARVVGGWVGCLCMYACLAVCACVWVWVCEPRKVSTVLSTASACDAGNGAVLSNVSVPQERQRGDVRAYNNVIRYATLRTAVCEFLEMSQCPPELL